MATSSAVQVAKRPAPRPLPKPRQDFFVYGINFAVLTTTPQQGAIQIQADADFVVQKMTFWASIGDAAAEQSTRILPNCTVQLTDSGTGRQLFNQPVAIPAIMGDGQIPFILPISKVFSANSSVTVAVANLSADTYSLLQINLIGAKVFRYG
jgi:hypothetical protein